MKKDRWVPMKRAFYTKDEPPEIVERIMALNNCTYAEARKLLEEQKVEYWLNDLYQVALYRTGEGDTMVIQLNIRRRDGKPIFRDWRHFQRIKNELVGRECEGIELYPAESRLVDTSNKYHIWCVPDPKYRFPFGFQERDVEPESLGTSPGLKQRKIS